MAAALAGSSSARAAAACLCLVALSCSAVGAEKVHSSPPTRMRGQAASAAHGTRQRHGGVRDPRALHDAVAEVLGSGHDVRHGKLLGIHAALEPMWRSLPANRHGRVDRKTLRYAVHRHLLHSSGLSMVGLEPGQVVNGTDAEAVLLMKRMPSYVRTTLEGKAAEQGFSIEDAVAMVATLEQLVSDASRDLLETVYESQGVSRRGTLSRAELIDLLEVYMLHWMMGDDTEGIQELVQNRTLLEEAFTDWHLIANFAAGRVRALEHERRGASPMGPAPAVAAWQPLRPEFSAADAEAIVTGVTMTFGRFWETECANVKDSLLKMDRDGTGRVRLSDFYGAAMDGEWRFSESKDYLRQLGALDESSRWQGPRVIIPNYLQAASNCIVSAPSHYRICCANECEDLLGELEVAIGRPMASPEEILALIVNMTTTLDDDGPKLSVTMLEQLRQIARPHGGQVPLHGRLFAQWLHYVFPRECPFPHKTGDSQALSPLEFGEAYVASDEEMGLHINAARDSAGSGNSSEAPDGNVEDVDGDFMSQWSHEEELLGDYAHLVAPWEAVDTSLVGLLALVVSVVGLLCRSKFSQVKRVSGSFLPTTSSSSSAWAPYGKSHYV